MRDKYILAFDSSNKESSVALFKDDELLVEKKSKQDFQHAEFLLPAIEAVLNDQKIWYEDISIFATCKGPGSFSGIRVALSIAKTIIISSNLMAVAFDSSQVLAMRHLEGDKSKNITIIFKAGFDSFYFARYKLESGKIIAIEAPAIISKEKLGAIEILENELICGNPIDQKFAKDIQSIIGREVNFQFAVDAAAIGKMAFDKMQNDDLAPYQNLNPIYSRPAI